MAGLLTGVVSGIVILAASAIATAPRVAPLMRQSQLPPTVALDTALCQSPRERARLLQAIDHSLRYLHTPKAGQDYSTYTAPGQPGAILGPNLQQRVIRSLQRFRHLVQTCRSAAELQAAVKREFVFYQAIGADGQGRVDFTGYYAPTYRASLVPTAEYRYPLFRRPPNFEQWPEPHPTRLELEGADGQQWRNGPLRGLELVYLRDRLEAFLVHVQGSAELQLPDGRRFTVGYAGKTNHPYTSIGQELIRDGKMARGELTLPRLIVYFQANPAELDHYLPRNASFVFFEPTQGRPPTGSLSIPVTPERSIATDKSLMPPGALAVINTQIPLKAQGQWQQTPVSRFVLDQDTGSAIRGPGRVDIFMGTGDVAKVRAGLINTPGQLYYLLLRE
ncbi:MAG: murein transglycosylase [Thermosynechococcus sp.]|uniref:murein transglycosylase A n=1 Tax=Thermosynechococcus sp. TaxID=2814275 RepID=UPI0022088ED7|nr:MltA domain-containing protein [Thermosynechococcus sp.]BCX12830.1 MAG: murein transglycosylase [Thermosynechococcus sp.]